MSKTVNTRFTIPRNIIAAMNGFQSQDGSRHVLQGTHFECCANSVTLIATCGRRMAMYHYEKHVLMPAGVTPVRFTADATDALKLFTNAKKEWTVDLNDDGSEVSFSLNADLAVRVRNLEESGAKLRFPFWRSVVPTTPNENATEFRFNPELMAPFTKAAKLLYPTTASIRIVAHENVGVNSSPYSIWIGDPCFYGVLMPMRGNDTQRNAPEWCRAPKVAPAEPTGETTQPAPVAEARVESSIESSIE